MVNVKKPIDYIQEASLENECGALLTPLALDAINKMMVSFARDYFSLRCKAEFELMDYDNADEFEQKAFGQALLPKSENLNN